MKIKIFLVIVLFLLFLESTEAFKISAFPAKIDLSTGVNKEVCKKISISSDKRISIYLEDKWTNGSKSSNLEDYTLSSDKLNIDISYSPEIEIDSKERIELCVIAKEVGEYNGLLIIKPNNSLAGIAVLINLEVLGSKSAATKKEISIASITGNMIKLNEEKVKGNFLVIFLLVLSLFLLLVFLLVLKKRD